ncbi:hypothetical protein PC9H_010775 [Pleurotus ostreatus]|uniref:F-box domain-containing protein n=1 Tax=Pleurotus ostreatus TaxID=5322 RepID=A0A8H6ZNF3_PLEOS|nr:uncharacterized protein PC9H_010775 [Pleurotus ostreatus]KAF7422619.1 hypothetical protein PC9H_010775 [Pleurotus ostreatus]KAJ8691503.1 hypothetical protein PTI98_011069 [Pleurotus ostreatus]
MPALPIEIVYSIVDELSNDKNSLLTVLLVCHDLNRQALRSLYEDLSFDIRTSHRSLVSLRKLSRAIDKNPGLQHTKGFSICFPDSHLPAYRQAYRLLDDVIPALANLRCLSMSCPLGDVFTPATLRLVMSTAQLTHLYLDCVLYSDDFIDFLADHPSLRCLALYAFMDGGGSDALPAGTLPNLRSLAVPTDPSVLVRFGDKPSLSDLSLIASEYPYQTIDARPIADGFATIRTLCTVGIDFPSVLALIPLLPNLEYLTASGYPPSNNHDFTGLASSKLKYVQLDFLSDPLFFSSVFFAAVETLLIVDVLTKIDGKIDGKMKKCRRVYRNSSNNVVLADIVTGNWQQWWEPIEKDLQRQIRL